MLLPQSFGGLFFVQTGHTFFLEIVKIHTKKSKSILTYIAHFEETSFDEFSTSGTNFFDIILSLFFDLFMFW